MSTEYSPDRVRVINAELHILRADNPVVPYPVVFATGFGNDADAYRIATRAIKERGIDVVCPDYQYGGEEEPKFFKKVPNVNELKIGVIEEAVEKFGVIGENGEKQVHLVAHSKGFIDSVTYALRHPQNVRGIVGVAPFGLHRNWPGPLKVISIVEAARNEKKDNADKEKRAETEPALRALIAENDIFKEWWRKQGLRYKVEALSAATRTVQDKLRVLANKGIGIDLILLADDSMFSNEKYVKDVVEDGTYDRLLVLPGIHAEVKYDPVVARTAADIIRAREQKDF